MALVFCRGCGNRIHESAPACPGCGAPQSTQAGAGAAGKAGRHPAALAGMALVWTAAFWVAGLMLSGAVAGMMNPDDAHRAGEQAGEALAGPLLLLALAIAVALTVAGWLPGTRRGPN